MNSKDNVRVIVDAGHGGTDPGAVNGNIYEKDFNLQAAQYIYKRLKELEIPVEMTRTEDISLPKDERIEKVQSFGLDPNTILVSNHINSGGGEGAEVVYALRNDSTLANMVLNNIGSAGQIMRKVYQRRLPENPNKDYYYIIRETDPNESILIEYGFIDNPNDLLKLQNNLNDYAEGVVKAIADYTGTSYSPPGSIPSVPLGTYTVVKGDTLYSIAGRYGISVNELKALNDLSSNIISIGQQLKVPSVNKYTVVKGDSLWSIARKFDITVNDLINANNLDNLTIYVGQELTIPSGENTGTPTIVYTVVKGDTLWNIAKRYNTTVDDIIRLNNLSSTLLSLGQQLIIPQ